MKGLLSKLLSLRSLSLKEHLVYWVLPLSVAMVFLFLYCFGTHGMQEFVSPEISREYGTMEALQALILVVAIYFSVKCFIKSPDTGSRIIFGIAIPAFLFLCLEEIDYGRTYYYYIFNVPEEERAIIRAVHDHNAKRLAEMKEAMYIFIMIAFILLPLIDRKWIPPFFQKFIASPKIILTAASLEITSLTSSFLIYQLGFHGNKSLDYNISEFGEVIIYYMLLRFMIELYQNILLELSIAGNPTSNTKMLKTSDK